jgi:hypothetical protein
VTCGNFWFYPPAPVVLDCNGGRAKSLRTSQSTRPRCWCNRLMRAHGLHHRSSIAPGHSIESASPKRWLCVSASCEMDLSTGVNLRTNSASRSEYTRETAMPRGCRPASRSALVSAGTDSTKQRFVPPPSAIDLGHCHAQYSAYPATAQRGGHADLVGLPPRRKRGLLSHNQDDGVDAHMLLAAAGCHQLGRALAGSRCDSPQ